MFAKILSFKNFAMSANEEDQMRVELLDERPEPSLNLCEISLSSNAWVTKECDQSTEVITEFGLGNWMNDQTIVSVYFHIDGHIKADLYIKCKVPEGKSQIQVKIGQKSKVVEVEGNYYQWFKVAKYKIIGSGYIRCDLKGVQKSGAFFADVSHLMFVHNSNEKCISFIRQINSDHTYWSRRGPSIHLWYDCSQQIQSEYYLSEVTIPRNADPIGSYFMAIGFDVGYFGIQVNSNTERRVLFSVWSPQQTDNPSDVSNENKVSLVAKGHGVESRPFGGEGSGRQNILRYMWSSEVTYKFLVRGKPDPIQSDHSLYTAWFASQTDSEWKLIATVKRPKSGHYLKGFYSFVENFSEEIGFVTRKGRFGNQWICDSKGQWSEVTRAKITGDSTAKNKVRLDFDGGIEMDGKGSETFYLKNCGFFNGNVKLWSEFERNANKMKPQINLDELDQIEFSSITCTDTQ